MFLLRRLLGVKTEDKKQTKVSKLVKNELLLINIGSTSTGGRVISVKADLAKIQLTSPACTEVGEKVALSRRIEKHWRLVGKYSKLFQFLEVTDINVVILRLGKCAAWYGPRSRLTPCNAPDIHYILSDSRSGGVIEVHPKCMVSTSMILGAHRAILFQG